MDRAFRRAVLQRLAMLDEMAGRAGTDLPAPVARAELRRIAGGWRDLLTAHQPDSMGRCPVCSGWLRRRRWPCQVWITAHQQLIGETTDATPQRRPALGGGFRMPRDVEIVARNCPPPAEPDQRIPHIPASREPLPERHDVRIHRASVTERHPTMPRPRFARRPRR